MKTFLKILSLFLLVITTTQPAWADRSAQTLVAPTRIVLENGAHFASLTLKNVGDAAGRYAVELLDTHMNDNGEIQIFEKGEKGENSAKDLISISPRTITLKQDEFQTIRILVKNTNDLPDGEYRSHIRIKITEPDLNPLTNAPNLANDQKGTAVVPKIYVSTFVPLIIRKGQTAYNVTIAEAKLQSGAEKPQIKMVFNISGNRSVIGDLHAIFTGRDGKDIEIGKLEGFTTYREVTKRNYALTLDVPPGLDINAGKIRVTYISPASEGNKVIAEHEVTP